MLMVTNALAARRSVLPCSCFLYVCLLYVIYVVVKCVNVHINLCLFCTYRSNSICEIVYVFTCIYMNNSLCYCVIVHVFCYKYIVHTFTFHVNVVVLCGVCMHLSRIRLE